MKKRRALAKISEVKALSSVTKQELEIELETGHFGQFQLFEPRTQKSAPN